MNAIKLLKDDHKTVNMLFKRFERSGERAFQAKRDIVERIVEELSVHAAIEEQVLYPAVRAEVRGAESLALEALEEHHIVKWTLSELDGMDPHDERFDAKVTVLIESVRHHVEEEEGELFPKMRDALSRSRLEELGKALEMAKKIAPTRPHPRLPDSPPLNLVAGAVGLADRVSERVVETAKSAVGGTATRSKSTAPKSTAPKAKRTAKTSPARPAKRAAKKAATRAKAAGSR